MSQDPNMPASLIRPDRGGTRFLGLASLLVLAGASFASGAEQGGAAPVVAPRPDFKVVFWYRRSRPIETFQYQVYDVRKGEYTQAVIDWQEMMRARFPGYEVAVRDVSLEREKGPNEARKVGAVVHRELLAVAAEQGVFAGPFGPAATGLRIDRSPAVAAGIGPARVVPPYSPLLGPPALPMGFPVPMPYPRPHP
jgi:hypothetical protein